MSRTFAARGAGTGTDMAEATKGEMNFAKDRLKRIMKATYESPGLRGYESHDRNEAQSISDAVPRGNPDAGKNRGVK